MNSLPQAKLVWEQTGCCWLLWIATHGELLLQVRCTPASLSPLRVSVAPHTLGAKACSQAGIKKQLMWSICMPKITSRELCTGTVFQAEIYPADCSFTLPSSSTVYWCFQYKKLLSLSPVSDACERWAQCWRHTKLVQSQGKKRWKVKVLRLLPGWRVCHQPFSSQEPSCQDTPSILLKSMCVCINPCVFTIYSHMKIATLTQCVNRYLIYRI